MSFVTKLLSRGLDCIECGLDCIEYGIYGLTDRAGSCLQMLSGSFLAYKSWHYAHQNNTSWWNNDYSKSGTEAWIATPITTLSEYAGIDPTLIASALFIGGTMLKLVGRSTERSVRVLKDKRIHTIALIQDTLQLTAANTQYAAALAAVNNASSKKTS